MSGAVTLFAACGGGGDSGPSASDEAVKLADQSTDAPITVSSSAFGDGDPIPVEYTCDGDDVSPPLAWQGVPADAAEVALVMDDPDADTFVHWVVWGIDPATTELEQGSVPDGARQAKGPGGDAAYFGSCPDAEEDPHTYRFTVFALDEATAAEDGADAADALAELQGTATAKGTLTGTFDR